MKTAIKTTRRECNDIFGNTKRSQSLITTYELGANCENPKANFTLYITSDDGVELPDSPYFDMVIIIKPTCGMPLSNPITFK